MSIPVWVLLAFAGWTLLTLIGGVGVYRWRRILARRSERKDFPGNTPEREDWYRRATRAHANCLENLPVYAAIVIAIVATGQQSAALDALAITLMGARVVQTLIHVGFVETNATVGIRFTFFFVQVFCMIAMGLRVAVNA